MKSILVTGHRGYIGAHLVELLKQSGYRVAGCDLQLHPECLWDTPAKPDQERTCDVRELSKRELEGFDCVVHLAALSNDPMGSLDPMITKAINCDATLELAKRAKEAGVGAFLFASSCSIYGKGSKALLSEEDPVSPLTAYAESKIAAEEGLLSLHGGGFSVSILRNATAYGYSPCFRVDLVVNHLLGSALAHGEVRVLSDGSPWRPLIHCRDIARAFVAFAEAGARVGGKVVNIGSNRENYSVRSIAEEVTRAVPGARVVYSGEAGPDPRNYRVCFDRLEELLPEFRPLYSLSRGIEELHRNYLRKGFSKTDFEGGRFERLKTLKKRLDEHSLYRG